MGADRRCLGLVSLIGILVHLTYRCCKHPVPIVLYTLVTVLVSSISDTDSIGTTPTLLTLLFFIASISPADAGLRRPGEARTVEP